MRKTCTYYSPNQINLLQGQIERFKLLAKFYPQLTIQQSIPSKFNPREDYIRITNSQAAPIYHSGLISTIIYCSILDHNKKTQIQQKYKSYFKSLKNIHQPTLYITNSFTNLIKDILKQLGYQEQKQICLTLNNVNESIKSNLKPNIQSRFDKDKQSKGNIKNTPQFVPKSQFLDQNIVNQIVKTLKIEIQDIQNCKISILAQKLQKQLKQYLNYKQIQPLGKQFLKIRQSKSIKQLCRACLYFYTLQNFLLYQNLNFLLRNIRSVVFREQLEKLKLFCFLLTLNYLYAYSFNFGIDEFTNPTILYRYSDWAIDPELIGQIVTIPSFYSVSSKQDIPKFKNKPTKIIIHPLTQGNSSISVNSLYPIHIFSAFSKEEQYLYTPFTCFLVTQIRYKKSQQKWIVNIKEIPQNPAIKKIIDMNLLNNKKNISPSKTTYGNNNKKTYIYEWELKCQQRYQYSKDLNVRIRTYFNLGLIFQRLIQKSEMAINYFMQGIQYIKKQMPPQQLNTIFLLFKGKNYLGLSYLKNNQLTKSEEQFKIAEAILEKLENLSKTKQVLQKYNSNIISKLSFSKAALKNNKGMLLQQSGKAQKAQIHYKEALEILQKSEIKNQLMEACILNNLGICIGKYSQTKQNIIKQNGFIYIRNAFIKYLNIYGISYSTKQSTTIKSEKGEIQPQKQLLISTQYISKCQIKLSELIPVLQNCSLLHQLNLNNSLAIYYQNQAIQLYKRMNLVQQVQSSTSLFMRCRLAKLLAKQAKYKQCIQLYESLLTVSWILDNSGLKSASIKSNIASVYVNSNEEKGFQKAVWWYNEAIRDISSPLLSENLEFYNKLCDLKKDIEGYLQIMPEQK